ncbi:MAG TPA: aldo/keto reductase [Streptosporangiaceae bacterium]|jgi:aryl-alcohol dehydrogenase-like predicted oxidoreductase
MESRRLGDSGLRVSRIGLGTMTWGHDTGEEAAAELLSAFADAGGSLLDTADVYAGGESERMIGALLDRAVPRADLVISTKAALTPDGPGDRDASGRHLLAALDGSLRRLGTDHVDIWHVHAYDPDTPLEETLAALDTAVATGRARYAGVAAYASWQLARAATWQRAWPGRTPITSTQAEYSLLARAPEDGLLAAASDVGTGFLAWSPLGRGVLTGKYRTGIPVGSRGADEHLSDFVEPYFTERARAIVESVATAADGLGVSPLSVALTWVRDRPGVTAPIVGARTTKQLQTVLESEPLTLPREISAALDDVSDHPPEDL